MVVDRLVPAAKIGADAENLGILVRAVFEHFCYLVPTSTGTRPQACARPYRPSRELYRAKTKGVARARLLGTWAIPGPRVEPR